MTTTLTRRTHAVVVIGVSAGGFEALKRLLGALPAAFPLPILIVQHLRSGNASMLAGCLQQFCRVCLKEADEGEVVVAGTVYFAPPDYHLLVESNATLSLSIDAPVRHARPSVDVLFGSAADAFGPGVIGVILTGANDDGSVGLKRIKDDGGIAIVQDPDEAEVKQMPLSALQLVAADYVATLDQIARLLVVLSAGEMEATERE